jgi:hypothetical protein
MASTTTRALVLCLAMAFCAAAHAQRLGGPLGATDEEEAGDGTRVSGTLEVTCTPDEKSKKAGAAALDDTVTMAEDRVQSKALGARGYPEALAIPKTVNGVVTMTAVFKKKTGEKGTYSLRIKKDGAVSGSLTTVEGTTKYRYLVRTKGSAATADPDAPASAAGKKRGKSKAGKGGGDVAEADPEVIRVDGGFVRLMTTNVALTEARVKDDAKKAKVAAIQKAAGTEWQALKGTYRSGAISAAEYAEAAGRRLDEANAELAALLGDEIADLDAAYAKPATAEFLYHNAMRAALAELDDPGRTAAADKAVHQSMTELALLVRKPAGREADVLAKFRELTEARVQKALPAPLWARVQKTVAGLTSYRPGAATPPPAPIELP